jgi:hypothetical protein
MAIARTVRLVRMDEIDDSRPALGCGVAGRLRYTKDLDGS